MTEVTQPSVAPGTHELVQVRHYEAGPPPGLELVEPGETIATTKEEEWISKKKTELTTTKQIETRVKRQVVLEDGKVVEDSGPIVTTNTSEDTEKQEHTQTELRREGEDEPDAAIEAKASPSDKKDWVTVPNPNGVVREVKEKRVISREETEEVKETEESQHLGDITDEDFIKAVHSGESDLRPVLRQSSDNRTVATTGPRIVHESTKSRKVTDTEDTAAVSSVRPDGKIVTETKTTTEHEEVLDQEVPDGEVVQEKEVENSQRYLKTKDQEFVEYLADGVKIGEEMRYKAETTEGEKFGEGGDDPHNWDSLSTRMRRQRRHQQHRTQLHKPKGVEEQLMGPLLDRKDALTRKPLDFDEEEETRKAETSKWLENHFGSESTRSSRDSIDEDEPQVPSKSFFNVTIKSQPTRVEQTPPKSFVATVNTTQKMYSPSPEPEKPARNGYYQGISEWSERKHEEYTDRYRTSPYTNGHAENGHTNGHTNGINGHRNGYTTLQRIEKIERIEPQVQRLNYREDEQMERPIPPERRRAIERRQRSSQDSNRYDSGYRTHSRNEMSRDSHDEPQDEPPPDYSPPPHHSPPPRQSPPRLHTPPRPHSPPRHHTPPRQSPPRQHTPSPQPINKKSYQRTRFANDPPKQKHGNIIGQSIRKLVGKIRSASAERRNKQRAKRSPSPPTYQQYNIIDNIPRRTRDSEPVMAENRQHIRRTHSPVQRYYLGEDPFGGSIYGRENKYDGVKPARKIKQHRSQEEDGRSHSTLGRFSKSTSRLISNNSADYSRSVQTLPRNIHSENSHSPPTRLGKQEDNTINVSIINTVSQKRPLVNGGPAKPARTYKSALTRSKSFNVHAGGVENGMYKSNPHLHRLDENPIGLKSPGIVSSISRSQRDLTVDPNEEISYTTRYVKNGYENTDNKKVFMKGLKERAPELFKTLHSDEEEKRWQSKPVAFSTPLKSSRIANYNTHDIYEPPTRLIPSETYAPQPVHTVRRGSNSTDDYSETYHITSRNEDPHRPSVTNTVQSFSKKTVPTKNGRSMQTIESSETRTVTKSRMREPNVKYIENGGSKYNTNNRGVVIEVKNYRN